jgi:hypothetical protein
MWYVIKVVDDRRLMMKVDAKCQGQMSECEMSWSKTKTIDIEARRKNRDD